MDKSLQDYFNQFDEKFKDLDYIDRNWYEQETGVISYCSKASTKDTDGKFSEEYIRARFVWGLINSGKYNKEYMCVEFKLPKGNSKTPLKPDIVVFKSKEWITLFKNNNFPKLRQNMLVVFETKKNSKTVEAAIENQLRSAMTENTSKERIFGVYFDHQKDILIFKKVGNSELRRFNEDKETQQDGITGWNIANRDLLIDLPTQKDLVTNNESITDLKKLKLDYLDAIDEGTFTDLMNGLKRANDSIRPNSPLKTLVVEFLTLKVFDEKRSKKNNCNLSFYILPSEKTKDCTGTKDFRERISQLYKDAEKDYPKVLGVTKRTFKYLQDGRPTNTSDEKFLVAIVEIFQKRAILKARNESFNQIIFNNFGDDKQKAEKGQFFTPISVVKSIIKLLNTVKEEEVCDPCCGICDFPAMSFRWAHRKDPDFPPNASNYYGFDLEASNLKLAELNLVLNGDGGAVLEHMNSLSQKLLLDGTVIPEGLFTTEHYDPQTWNNKHDSGKDLKKFKVVATNPPFGKGRDLKTGAKGKWDLPKETVELY